MVYQFNWNLKPKFSGWSCVMMKIFCQNVKLKCLNLISLFSIHICCYIQKMTVVSELKMTEDNVPEWLFYGLI